MNIILTGFMGSGKTSTGRALAQRTGLTFVDTDLIIEDRHGPIADIFANGGESAFRRIEAEVAAELGDRDGLVIATGGRLMLDEANAAALSATGPVFCLVASADEILARVLADPSPVERPLLAGDDPAGRIRELLAERAEGYGRFTPVDTSGLSPDQVADAIVSLLDPLPSHPCR